MPSFTQATRSDLETFLTLQRDFYAGASLEIAPEVIAATSALIDDDALGLICLVSDDTGIVGYFVLTYGYSLERGGRFALLDELYIVPAARNRGLGRAAVTHAAELACSARCRSLHLEAEHRNLRVQALYAGLGFLKLARHYLTLPLHSRDDC
jgi:ribosomal protein S18 acetylase RimI-like enzyme